MKNYCSAHGRRAEHASHENCRSRSPSGDQARERLESQSYVKSSFKIAFFIILFICLIFLLPTSQAFAAEDQEVLDRLQKLEEQAKEKEALEKRVQELEGEVQTLKGELSKRPSTQVEPSQGETILEHNERVGEVERQGPVQVEVDPNAGFIKRTIHRFDLRGYPAEDRRSFLTRGLYFGGFIDARFEFDEDALFDGCESFNFFLQEAELDLEKYFGDFALLRIDLDFGVHDKTINPASLRPELYFLHLDNSHVDEVRVEQAFGRLFFPIMGRDLEFTFGRFEAPIGYEGVDLPDRFTAQRSLIDELGEPTLFTGAMLSYPVTPWSKLYAFVTNGWEINSDVNDAKAVGGRLEIKPNDKVEVGVSTVFSAEQPFSDQNWRKVVDVFLEYKPAPKWTVIAQGNFGWEDGSIVGLAPLPMLRPVKKWGIFILYPAGSPITEDSTNWQAGSLLLHHQMWAWFGSTIRYEIFNDNSGARIFDKAGVRDLVPIIPGDQIVLNAFTWTGTFTVYEHIKFLLDMTYTLGNNKTFLATDRSFDRTNFLLDAVLLMEF